jgi:hypothetical protein
MAQLNSTNVIGNLSVAGQLTAAGNTTFNGLVTIANTTDAALTSANSALRIGAIGGEHIAIDGNEIMTKNNSSPATLYLNNEGGLVQIGSGGLTVSGVINAAQGSAASSTTTGALRVTGGLSTTKASWIGGGLLTIKSSDDNASSAITLWRGSNASWKIENASGTLHFNCNYTTSA